MSFVRHVVKCDGCGRERDGLTRVQVNWPACQSTNGLGESLDFCGAACLTKWARTTVWPVKRKAVVL